MIRSMSDCQFVVFEMTSTIGKKIESKQQECGTGSEQQGHSIEVCACAHVISIISASE